ncbi:hypothetical protein NOR_06177 [Metarhizium rileyi]|uniref:Uncharacterized protein n=1 Tax=Metarhizium rileyi (strain RCEF 4871) TaxID=1649241 RepID=A0A167B840_METRR|nr:hypothetical protein NOR_06177 [Metarhizium rileyi RCEF 4871]
MASTNPPPAYTAGTAPPSYEALMKRFNDSVGPNPTPEKYLEVGDAFTLDEIEILASNSPTESPPVTCPEDAKRFKTSAGKGLSSSTAQEAFQMGAAQATEAAQGLRRMFGEIHRKILEIDQIEISGFEPNMRQFKNKYETILSESRAVANDISTYGAQFDKLIVPFCIDKKIDVQDKMEMVRGFISVRLSTTVSRNPTKVRRDIILTDLQKATDHEKRAKKVQTDLRSLQTDFISWVPRFDDWAQKKEGNLLQQIRAIQMILVELQKDLADIEHKIRVVGGAMVLSGGLMAAAVAGGPVGLVVGLFGFIGLSASAAILIVYNRKRAGIKREILQRENEIEDIQKDIKLIQDTRVEITNLRDEHLPTINANIDLLDSYWQAVVGEAQYLLQYLEGAEDVEVRHIQSYAQPQVEQQPLMSTTHRPT